MVANVDRLLTIEDLETMPDDDNRYELIEGILYVSRAPSFKHQRIIYKISHFIGIYLDQNPIGEVCPTPGVIFGKNDSTIPDLVYISNERLDEIVRGIHVEGTPELIVEVLSPGKDNIERDREIKFRTYSKYHVKEYWIADPANLTVEIYSGSDFNAVTTFTINDELTSSLLPGFRCKVSAIFAQRSPVKK